MLPRNVSSRTPNGHQHPYKYLSTMETMLTKDFRQLPGQFLPRKPNKIRSWNHRYVVESEYPHMSVRSGEVNGNRCRYKRP